MITASDNMRAASVKTDGMKAMILAAGLGTRFKPWTDQHPKALAPVNGKSLLQRNIEYLQRYGIRDVIVNVHHFAGQIIDALRENAGWGSHYTISDETAEVLETGGGLVKARPWLDPSPDSPTDTSPDSPTDASQGPSRDASPFILMNVDILTDLDLSQMIRDHDRHRPLATLAVTDRVTSRYFLFDGQQELCGWRNVKTGQERMARGASGETREGKEIGAWATRGASGIPATGETGETPATGRVSAPLTQRAFSGIHLIDPAIFPLIRQTGKFSTVDMYLDLAATHTIRGFDHSGSRLIDVGKPDSIAQAEKLFP